MSKKKRKRKRPRGGHAQARPTTEVFVAELEQRVAELESTDDSQAGAIWGAVHQLLLKTAGDPRAIGRIIASRDTAALAAFGRALGRGEVEAFGATHPDAAASWNIPHETLKKAMHAFRKRLKLTRLDHESKLGVGPMTSGRKADVDAILPPREFPTEVWEALVAQGKLKDAGRGFYALGDE